MGMYRKLMYSLMEGNDRDINRKELAEIIGADPTQVSCFFNYKNQLPFASWLLAIRKLRPAEESKYVDIIAEMMINDADRLGCRQLMEYASTNRNFSLLEKLINSQKDDYRENIQWARLYSIAMKYQQRTASNEEILAELDMFKATYSETIVFCNILKASTLYMLGEYKYMFRMAKLAEDQIKHIKNNYIADMYMARLSELFARGYLYLKNEPKLARFYGNMVLNSRYLSESYKTHVYHLMGTTYVFDDYDQSISYFNSYKDALKGGGREDLARGVDELDIFFLKVLWEVPVHENDTNDPLEKMHYYARLGERTKFESLVKEALPEDDPFALCYIGMINNDPEYLLHSIARFVELGNKFFAELPLREIQRMYNGHYYLDLAADIISNIKIA